MQSVKNKKISMKTVTEKKIELAPEERFFSKIALKLRAIKIRLFPPEDLAQMHLSSQNVKAYNSKVKSNRAVDETQARIFMFNR